jgi:hypothetical protein
MAYSYHCDLTPDEACDRIANFLESNPDSWLRGAYARERDGQLCQPDDPSAARFCALGLVIKFCNGGLGNYVASLLSAAVTPPGGVAVSAVRFNDEFARDVTDVIAMFRCAAQIARLAPAALGTRALYLDFVRPLPNAARAPCVACLPPPPAPDWNAMANAAKAIMSGFKVTYGDAKEEIAAAAAA